MNLYSELINRREKISVIGLGYVGLPIAVEFSKKMDVLGFDLNTYKLNKYRSGIDVTEEVGNEELSKAKLEFTEDEEKLQGCKFHVISVPTPINSDKTPDLKPIIKASEIVGRNLIKGSIVVYESTVYPGTTEEICIPILEKVSGLKHLVDFKVGYSPERINPGDKKNTLTNIIKVVSGADYESLEVISKVYESIITAGVHKAESIKVAEAAKVIENSQRDINIAFMNELSIVFDKMEIDTQQVLKAAKTKWNFIDFKPGLVGGHCIGVDPYYFVYKAEQLGYHSQIILAGRKINDGMGKHVATKTIKKLIKSGKQVRNAKVGILGVAFKEDCSDVRNSKVIDIIEELRDFDVEVVLHDPLVDSEDVKREYRLSQVDKEALTELDAIIMAVPHKLFLEKYGLDVISNFYKDDNKVLIDVKGAYDRCQSEKNGFIYWSL